MSVAQYYQEDIALGCTTTIALVTDFSSNEVDIIFAKLWKKIFEFEARFSRFLPASELSAFNRRAGMQAQISAEFRDILLKAKDMAQRTGSLYSPFVLPALQRAGYKHSFVDTYAADPVDDYAHRSFAEIEQLTICDTTAIIPAHSAIDLGGIGKGYLADQLRELPELQSMQGYWISLGGDITGCGHDADSTPWKVAVQNAALPNQALGYEYITDGSRFSIATSGTIIRRSKKGDKRAWHHIIDPRTSRPAETDLDLVTVVAESVCEADVLAKCAVILGSKNAKQFLYNQEVKSMLLQPSQVKAAANEVTGNFKLLETATKV